MKTACYLDVDASLYSEELRKVHPFMLIVDNNSPKPSATCVDVWSIRNGNMIHTIHFKSEITNLVVNSRFDCDATFCIIESRFSILLQAACGEVVMHS